MLAAIPVIKFVLSFAVAIRFRALHFPVLLALLLSASPEVQSQEGTYEIYAFKFADVLAADELSVVAVDAPKGALFDPVFAFWLIRDQLGRNVLVDSGFINDLDIFDTQYRLRNYRRPDNMLKGLGVKPEEITDIIITHPHKDHIGGIALFMNAQIWMQKSDFDDFVGAAWQRGREGDGYLERDVRAIIEANLSGRLTLVNGEQFIAPGIRVLTGSKHTAESQWVLVESDGRTTVIASDNAMTYFNIDEEKAAPGYATYDPDVYVAQIRRMKELVTDPKYVLPGHDNRLFERFPTVGENIVRIR